MSKKYPELTQLSYAELNKKMAAFSDDDVVGLLNSKSVKVGDTAASFINERNAVPLVLAAFDQGLITTRNGKMRIAYLLGQNKRSTEAALNVLFALVKDRIADVADSALFAIIKTGGIAAKSRLEETRMYPDISPEMKSRIGRALEAIEKNDPRIYSPNYGG